MSPIYNSNVVGFAFETEDGRVRTEFVRTSGGKWFIHNSNGRVLYAGCSAEKAAELISNTFNGDVFSDILTVDGEFRPGSENEFTAWYNAPIGDIDVVVEFIPRRRVA